MRAPLVPPEILLLGPGPSNPHPEVSAAMAAPLVSHLDPYFLNVMEDTMTDLRALFRTGNHHTVPVSATGTGGLETIMFNLVEPGDEVVVGLEEDAMLKGSLMVYLLPLLAMIGAALVADSLISVDIARRDLWVLVAAVAGFALMLAISRSLLSSRGSRKALTPVVLRKNIA